MKIRAFFVMAAVLLLTACATPIRLTNIWQDKEFRGVPFRHVLVVGFGEDGASRRLFEDGFVQALKAAGVMATPVYTLEAGMHESDPAKVRGLAARVGADAVLTTRLVGVDRRTMTTPGQLMVMPSVAYRRGFHGYYSSAIVMQTPPAVHHYEVVTLESSLWRGTGDSLVWSGTSERLTPEDAKAAAAELARAIIEALRGQGLL